jgi:hypothetical protein
VATRDFAVAAIVALLLSLPLLWRAPPAAHDLARFVAVAPQLARLPERQLPTGSN